MTVACSDESVRRALTSVLAPDNQAVPKGMTLSMKGSDQTVRLRVESESPRSVVSTSIALLLDIELFEQVWLLSTAADRSHRRRASP